MRKMIAIAASSAREGKDDERQRQPAGHHRRRGTLLPAAVKPRIGGRDRREHRRDGVETAPSTSPERIRGRMSS